MRGFLIVCASLAMTGAAVAQTSDLGTILRGPAGENRGWVEFTEGPKGVMVKVQVKGLTPGWHGLHFHEKSVCTGPDFKSAGSHIHGASAAVHGLLNPDGNEAGDLPNIFVGADGTGAAEIYGAGLTVRDAAGRVDIRSGTLVVHANADDHSTQPIGGAGARIACAQLIPTIQPAPAKN